MRNLFEQLVQAEHPHLIYNLTEYTDLPVSMIACHYAANGKQFVAVSYYTPTWISKSIAGPECNKKHPRPIRELADVATITEVVGASEAATKVPSKRWIMAALSELCGGLIEMAEQCFKANEAGDTFNYSVVFTPLPSLVVSIYGSGEVIGTLLITRGGTVQPVLVCNERLLAYYDLFKQSFAVKVARPLRLE